MKVWNKPCFFWKVNTVTVEAWAVQRRILLHDVIPASLVLSVFSRTWCDCWPYHVCVFQYVIQHVSRSCVCVTVVQQYFADAAKTHYQFWWEVSCWRHSWPGWWHHGKTACQLRHGSGLYMRQYPFFVLLYNFNTRLWISPFFHYCTIASDWQRPRTPSKLC